MPKKDFYQIANPEVIFVFGSNLAGFHGGGAARHAADFYGAEFGVGRGRTGRAYALPTKDEQIETLPEAQIEGYIADFIDHARANPDQLFLLTPVGTGLAGLSKDWLLATIKRHRPLPSNVMLTPSWLD